ncbi:hypothetical protein Sdiek1_1772 [Sulfurospirillum diekertiae]|uniref:Uncharacterized protein n=1 Tax=Sulfurospirillum diekertiae TaxID=1854492 RepID=A0A1Y0HLG4_9BACT|nr:hypothetical protein [Sulfurospirillum diekertiae]ARU48931.1 hypothetical protein Sdiek1_1772 [Sulfurospirillum diekertiae]ASC93750.1 hypothetical protein Sdiek2_1735 [Sulfurospirillum diekertiae]
MSKIGLGFVCWILACTCALSAGINYEYTHQFILKKDEIGLVLINHKEVTKKPTADNPNNEYILRLRWTLYTNNMLTVLVNYRGYPMQYIMQKKHPLETVVIPLLPDGDNKMLAQTYLKIVFNDFDQRNKEAILDIFIEDNLQRIEVEFKPKKKP